MKRHIGFVICAGVAWLAAPQAGASKAVQQLTVTLGSSAQGHEITVNGQTYTVMASPQNDSLLETLRPGDQVDLWIGQSGTAGSSTVNRITLRAKAAAQ